MKIQPIASGSKGNAYLVEAGSFRFLLEAGVPLDKIKRAVDYKLSDIDLCFVSHEHGDHALCAAKLAAAGVEVVLSQGTADALGLSGHHVRIIEALQLHYKYKPVALCDGTLLFGGFHIKHDAAEPLGFFIVDNTPGHLSERLLYICDAAEPKFTDGQWSVTASDYLLLECNHSKEIIDRRVLAGELDPIMAKRVVNNHISLESVLELLQRTNFHNLKEIWLLHLSDDNSDAELFKSAVEKAVRPDVLVYIA